MLRLASSTVIPNTLRILSSSSCISAFRHGFSHHSVTEADLKSSELIKAQTLGVKLVKILDSKIKYKQLSPTLKPMLAIPADFPFTIYDDPSSDKYGITLTRELNGEKIEVHVLMHFMTETYRNLDLYVKVFRQNGIELEFKLHFSAHHKITIEYMLVRGAEDRSFYMDIKGNDYESLFMEFLEIRGINTSYHGFLCDYMIRRSKVERISNLKGLKKFIEKI